MVKRKEAHIPNCTPLCSENTLCKILDQPDRPTVVPIVVVVRIHVRRVEVEFVSVVRVVRRRRPIVAVRANIVHRRTIAVATARKRHNAC